ncbi:serine/threonine-protein kinase [Mycobacterium sp.]|uniref:serine/threonine-protein kinase n=1 Tax=Mycobacterium sp. TaxID=1785 RepID=UPI000CAAA8D9|nr:serine/threonine-protein kinase [Mycobacterium sp.]PJE04047.1 MAG: serine/threonine protein kinase [Mycobacterium sp.]
MEGTRFGRYVLIELLGRGGMGEVWRAHDTETDRVVAIKLLPAHFSEDAEFQRRFRREAHAAARLNSPHIIPIHHYGQIDGRLYVDMRLIEGCDLSAVLSNGPLDPARAVHIIDQVAKALHAAHRGGLLHRDVKPSNVLLDGDDFAYLIDFGIARAAEDTRMTRSGSTIGTFAYIAPERLDPQAGEDARADIYSLACVLYECLTGGPPFPGDTMPQLVAAHLSTPPPRPSAAASGVPDGLDPVIAKGMAKDPRQRYATTVELADAARSVIASPNEKRSTPAPTAADSRRAPSAGKRLRPAAEGSPANDLRPHGSRTVARVAVAVATLVGIAAIGFTLRSHFWASEGSAGTTASAAGTPSVVTTLSATNPAASQPITSPTTPPTTASASPAASRAGFFGEWGQHATSVTLAPDGSAHYVVTQGAMYSTSWSATWSPMTSTTAMIVLTAQLDSRGDASGSGLIRYPGEAFTFTLQPNGYATITAPTGEPITLCPRGTGFRDTQLLCGA